ncbi:HAMP domain-containing sensor histidine kinase [Peribacillus kribbensis]|uniref:HAMP domain-containing sensor histidine kinase n=1 Tax=Peribacillus kribbensis TaxID=356658 RepID=UPI000429EF77|nr:HAMP domain-containing sensor histidine kinase [Peribacillus kribbensis]
MKWNSIVLKWGATIFLVYMSVLVPLILIINELYKRSYLHDARHQIVQLADYYSKTFSELDMESLHTAAKLTETDFCLIDQKGVVLVSSNIKLFPQGIRVERKLVNYAFAKKAVKNKEYHAEDHQNYFLSGKRLGRGAGEEEAGLFLFSGTDPINKSVHHMKVLVLSSMLGALCVALVFTYMASRKLASPLLKMERATRAIAKGKYYEKVPAKSKDELGSLAKAINDLGHELERYRNRQSELFANVSHDLRTPISYIKGYTQVIRDQLYKEEKEKELYLSIILSESDQLNALITDLFELSKIEGGQVGLTYDRHHLPSLIGSCLKKAELKAKHRSVHLHQEIDEGSLMVMTDGVRLEQILMNLVENAINYNKPDGHVTLKAWRGREKMYIQVRDTGIGIPREDLPFIYERFYKVDKSRTNRMGSTGLGLAIVKHLVLLLEGEIQVTSILHKGTTFTIALPADFQPARRKDVQE